MWEVSFPAYLFLLFKNQIPAFVLNRWKVNTGEHGPEQESLGPLPPATLNTQFSSLGLVIRKLVLIPPQPCSWTNHCALLGSRASQRKNDRSNANTRWRQCTVDLLRLPQKHPLWADTHTQHNSGSGQSFAVNLDLWLWFSLLTAPGITHTYHILQAVMRPSWQAVSLSWRGFRILPPCHWRASFSRHLSLLSLNLCVVSPYFPGV